MCNIWKYPTNTAEEVGIDIYKKLPFIDSINITGGEPFLRDDLDDIVSILKHKTNRLLITSNGFFTEKILKLFENHRDVGARISLEGLPKVNDELRGISNGFDSALRTLIQLNRIGIKDLGISMTVSDRNIRDMMELYYLAKQMKFEFATAAVHNSFYFHKYDNNFEFTDIAEEEFEKIISALLRSRKVKNWFRAYFNFGLLNYIKGNPRLLPCEMGYDSFFLDPYGEILSCNVIEKSMGNLKKGYFEELWNSKNAEEIRKMVKSCQNNCWMICSVSQQIKKYMWNPGLWILKHKFLKKSVDFNYE